MSDTSLKDKKDNFFENISRSTVISNAVWLKSKFLHCSTFVKSLELQKTAYVEQMLRKVRSLIVIRQALI